ncbi:hypothetical protein AVU99_gp124 [Mycobacterium phage Lolly9]|uniref:Uncharacterized protein n=1 Tax=Mycobacterium phage Lolly9 TaxID=1698711 RepID=A0A0K2FNV6_9CAUD|nr:hypothetical protein AVU99_gp124 [Mycobacterium phage Lolly9]ALA48473.1 hypothetical protein LOLLY9_56 [Mycobacterium phage Lolly9]QOP65784.1 hypothetical protein PBI_MINILON_60 [Mycobacterium phage MiniLon]
MASRIVREAIAKYAEAKGRDGGMDTFYPVPNRAMKRAFTFGGKKTLIPSGNGVPAVLMREGRSRITRGTSRPQSRGKVLTDGLKPIFVDEHGEVVDMAKFYEAAA